MFSSACTCCSPTLWVADRLPGSAGPENKDSKLMSTTPRTVTHAATHRRGLCWMLCTESLEGVSIPLEQGTTDVRAYEPAPFPNARPLRASAVQAAGRCDSQLPRATSPTPRDLEGTELPRPEQRLESLALPTTSLSPSGGVDTAAEGTRATHPVRPVCQLRLLSLAMREGSRTRKCASGSRAGGSRREEKAEAEAAGNEAWDVTRSGSESSTRNTVGKAASERQTVEPGPGVRAQSPCGHPFWGGDSGCTRTVALKLGQHQARLEGLLNQCPVPRVWEGRAGLHF